MRLEVVTTCEHWSQESGCALGLFDGEPTSEDCASCMEYTGPSRGFGDTVHSALGAVGIHALIDAARKKGKATKAASVKDKADGGCGCGKRRKALNNLLPAKGSD